MYNVREVDSPLSQSLSIIKNVSMSSLVQYLYLSRCWLTPSLVWSSKNQEQIKGCKGFLGLLLSLCFPVTGWFLDTACYSICTGSSTRQCLPWARQDGMVGIQNKVFSPVNTRFLAGKEFFTLAVPCSGKTDLCLPCLDSAGHQDLLFPRVLGSEILPRAQIHPDHRSQNWRGFLLVISLWANPWPPIQRAEMLELAEF